MRILRWLKIVINGKVNWFNILTYIWAILFGVYLVGVYVYYMVGTGSILANMAVKENISNFKKKL